MKGKDAAAQIDMWGVRSTITASCEVGLLGDVCFIHYVCLETSQKIHPASTLALDGLFSVNFQDRHCFLDAPPSTSTF